MRGICVCVHYDDLLRITLVRNMRHLTECLVVTHPEDAKTLEVVASVPGARAYCTDAFYRDGAKFNKGLAMEEGFDALGRGGPDPYDGWVLIWDADILLPEVVTHDSGLQRGRLYSANRLILEDPAKWSPQFDWRHADRTREFTFAGFFQLFHTTHQRIVNKRPWYDVDFTHAGGGDHYFQSLWTDDFKTSLPFNVLHLGPRDANWYGRCTPRLDGEPPPRTNEDMERLLRVKNWGGRHNFATETTEEKIR